MSSNVSSRQGPYCSSGSKGVIEVPRSIVKLSENMRYELDKLNHDDIKQKKEVLADAKEDLYKRIEELATEKENLHKRIEELAREKKDLHKTGEEVAREKKDLEHELRRKIAQLYEELRDACETFNGKVAGIKEYLEQMGFHNLYFTYTWDENKKPKDPRKGGY